LIGSLLIPSLITESQGGERIELEEKKSPNDKRMDWEILFITSRNECSDRNREALWFYLVVTHQYLEKYLIDNALTGFDCIPTNNMAQRIQEATSSSDITIIIPDIWQSVKQRTQTSSAGHFEFFGESNTILSQALTFQIENEFSAWVLSHELSHFALYWKGYPQFTKINTVHVVQAQYDACKKVDVTLAYCTDLWTTIKTPSGKNFYVMKIIETKNYEQPIQKQSSIPPTKQPTPVKPPTRSMNEQEEDVFLQNLILLMHQMNEVLTTSNQLLTQMNEVEIYMQNLNFQHPLAQERLNDAWRLYYQLKTMVETNNLDFIQKGLEEIEKGNLDNAYVINADTNILSGFETMMYIDRIITDAQGIEVSENKKETLKQKIIERNQRIKKMAIKDEILSLKDKLQKTTLDLENGMKTAEKSLTGLTFQDQDAKEKINDAWTKLKETREIIDTIHFYSLNINHFLEDNVQGDVRSQYDAGKQQASKAGKNLIEISELIEDAKLLDKPQFCFLFWCW